MSADNGIYILVTTDKHKKLNQYTTENTFGKGITAYRVAHCQAIDNLDWYEHNEFHNFGYILDAYFGKSELFYDRGDALLHALNLQEDVGYTEHGISEIDCTKYNFPGF